MSFLKKRDKAGQVTIFIIIAIILVGGAISFFVFRDSLTKTSGLPKTIEPIYNSFLSCLEEDSLVAVNVLMSQGGRIYLPQTTPGSTYAPFSNMLNFVGSSIPYWYYISSNGGAKEAVPTESEMEGELSEFIEARIKACALDNYYDQGFEVYMGEPEVKVEINDKSIDVKMNMGLAISFEEDSSVINTHVVSINSNLGGLYSTAVEIYNKEQEELFLEDYAIDFLRLYAPVDGVELTCSPKMWNADTVFNDVKSAVESNTLALRNKGGDYTLVDKNNKYFVLDFDSDYDIRFLNSANWSSSYEVFPSKGNIMMATPIGNQAGLGMLGFCYVPYHFVYNMKYPVLAQVSSGTEVFQFPMAVVIEGNNPRESLPVKPLAEKDNQLCEYQNTLMDVIVYDNSLNPIEADVTYECVGTTCDIGKTDSISGLSKNFPQCANGFVKASAQGYVDGKKIASTIVPGTVEVVLNKLHELDINLKLGSSIYEKDAIIYFSNADHSATVIYPETRKVELAEGQYEIRVYVYRNSSLTIPSTTKDQCVDSPQSGLGGLFGLTEEKCFKIEMPAQIVSNALAGGGVENYYILDSELSSATEIEISALTLPSPVNLEKLQENYVLFEENGLGVNFR